MEAVKANARARKPMGEAPAGEEPPPRKPFKLEPHDALRGYRMYGLDPVYADKACTTVVSLSMLLKLGWKIQVVGDNQFELLKPVGK